MSSRQVLVHNNQDHTGTEINNFSLIVAISSDQWDCVNCPHHIAEV